MKKSILILMISLFIFSCDSAKKETIVEKPTVKEEVAANYKSIEVEIEGMTCEIGCARTIQSKLSKFKGVTYSKVSFETKTGQFTYDANKIKQEDIVNKISGIAGGDLYSVTKTEDIELIIKEEVNKID